MRAGLPHVPPRTSASRAPLGDAEGKGEEASEREGHEDVLRHDCEGAELREAKRATEAALAEKAELEAALAAAKAAAEKHAAEKARWSEQEALISNAKAQAGEWSAAGRSKEQSWPGGR